MGIFTKDIQTMEDLLLHGLQDIYYAEQQITKALPKMIEKPLTGIWRRASRTIWKKPTSRLSGLIRFSRS
jgi:hypothetical protein